MYLILLNLTWGHRDVLLYYTIKPVASFEGRGWKMEHFPV
jgi:hypothetical protein